MEITIIAHSAILTLPYALEKDLEPKMLSTSQIFSIFPQRYKDEEPLYVLCTGRGTRKWRGRTLQTTQK